MKKTILMLLVTLNSLSALALNIRAGDFPDGYSDDKSTHIFASNSIPLLLTDSSPWLLYDGFGFHTKAYVFHLRSKGKIDIQGPVSIEKFRGVYMLDASYDTGVFFKKTSVSNLTHDPTKSSKRNILVAFIRNGYDDSTMTLRIEHILRLLKE